MHEGQPNVEINHGEMERMKKELDDELPELPSGELVPEDPNEPYYGALEMVDEVEEHDKLQAETNKALAEWRKEVQQFTKHLPPDINISPVDPRDIFAESLENPPNARVKKIYDRLKNSSLRRNAANLLDQLDEISIDPKKKADQKKAA